MTNMKVTKQGVIKIACHILLFFIGFSPLTWFLPEPSWQEPQEQNLTYWQIALTPL